MRKRERDAWRRILRPVPRPFATRRLTSFILAPRLLIPTRLVADIEGDVDAEAASPPRRPESTAAATPTPAPSSSSSSSNNKATEAEIPPPAIPRFRGDPDPDDDDDDATPPPRAACLDERGAGMEKARQQGWHRREKTPASSGRAWSRMENAIPNPRDAVGRKICTARCDTIKSTSSSIPPRATLDYDVRVVLPCPIWWASLSLSLSL